MNSQLLSLPRSLFSSFFSPSFLGDLCCYISFSSVHPPPTLVSHPCPYLSARPIGYSFWYSVSCCGPHHSVQGSHPHQWGQGVSCGYLIWRWQLLLGLLFYHAPMAGPLGLESPLGSSRGLPQATWRLPLLWFWSAKDRVLLGTIFWQSGFPSFVLGNFFLLDVGLGLDMEWTEVSRSLWPHILFFILYLFLHFSIIFIRNFRREIKMVHTLTPKQAKISALDSLFFLAFFFFFFFPPYHHKNHTYERDINLNCLLELYIYIYIMFEYAQKL